MCLRIRAHFDGHVIIPDQPVDLPLNTQLELEVRESLNSVGTSEPSTDQSLIQERLRKLHEFFDRRPLGDIPLESLRRENLYEDRG